MACDSLIPYVKECQKKAGGVQELYLISYADLGVVEGSTDAFEVGVSGEITDIAVLEDKNFVKVGIIKNTVALTETLTVTPATGTSDIATEMTLILSQITSTSRAFAESLKDGEVAALIHLRSGVWIATGLTGGLEVATIVGSTGTAGADLNGYTITFNGVENELSRVVDPTIIPTLLVPAVEG